MPKPSLQLMERVNRLFDSSHSVGEPEEDNESVASAVGAALGRPIAARDIAALRFSGATNGDADMLSALAAHFDAPRAYLWSHWDYESQRFDNELTLLFQMRDLGVVRLAMRNGNNTTAEDLSHILTQLPPERAVQPAPGTD